MTAEINTQALQTALMAEPTCRADVARELLNRLDNMDADASAIQAHMIELLEPMVDWNKHTIVQDSALASVFTSETTGLVRRQLIAWLEAHTPIRVKRARDKEGKPTGQIKGIGMARKGGEWDLVGARVTPFLEFAPSQGKAKGDPSIERGINALVREAARKLDTSDSTLESIKAEIQSNMVDKLAELILAERENEKHTKWVSEYKEQRAEAARAKGE